MEKINVYDNYEIDLNKYPRKELKRIFQQVLYTFNLHLIIPSLL